jgi:hypothetical protein
MRIVSLLLSPSLQSFLHAGHDACVLAGVVPGIGVHRVDKDGSGHPPCVRQVAGGQPRTMLLCGARLLLCFSLDISLSGRYMSCILGFGLRVAGSGSS